MHNIYISQGKKKMSESWGILGLDVQKILPITKSFDLGQPRSAWAVCACRPSWYFLSSVKGILFWHCPSIRCPSALFPSSLVGSITPTFTNGFQYKLLRLFSIRSRFWSSVILNICLVKFKVKVTLKGQMLKFLENRGYWVFFGERSKCISSSGHHWKYIFTRGAATSENITEGVHEMK